MIDITAEQLKAFRARVLLKPKYQGDWNAKDEFDCVYSVYKQVAKWNIVSLMQNALSELLIMGEAVGVSMPKPRGEEWAFAIDENKVVYQQRKDRTWISLTHGNLTVRFSNFVELEAKAGTVQELIVNPHPNNF